MKKLLIFVVIFLVVGECKAQTLKASVRQNSNEFRIPRNSFQLNSSVCQVQLQPQQVQNQFYIPKPRNPQNNGVFGIFSDAYSGRVLQIFPGSDCNGKLQINDRIEQLDFVNVPSYDLPEASLGAPGSVVQVTIVRAGERLVVPIVRTDWRIYQSQGLPFDYANPARIGIRR